MKMEAISPYNPLWDWLWWGKRIGRYLSDSMKEKHCWVIMGDTNSGKTEFLCMLKDRKDSTKLSHASASTKVSTTEEVDVMSKKVVFCDGPGAICQKKSRLHDLLNDPVKNARAKKQRLVLLYMVDMSKITSDDDRKKVCKNLFAEVGLFFKGFEQLRKTETYRDPISYNVSQESLNAVGGKVFVIGTHMDIVRDNIRKRMVHESLCDLDITEISSPIPGPDPSLAEEQMERESFMRIVDEQRMHVPLSPFIKDLSFEFIFGDIFSHKGRCEFFEEFYGKL